MLAQRWWVLLYLAIAGGCETIDHHTIDATIEMDAEQLVAAEPDAPPIPAPAIQTDVWSVLRAGFVLDHAQQQRSVVDAIESLLNHPPLPPNIELRARRYLAYVVDEVHRRNLPMELALVPIIESALNPYADSARGASGLWQLIPSTAKHYGVVIDWWYDGRRDPIDSTAAALDYLTYLHEEFGDWLLAIAAYNGGEGRVRRALAAAPGAGFFDLALPRETRAYVPKLLALAHVVAQGDETYPLPRIDTEPAFFAATLDGQIDLGLLANLGPLSIEELFRFNAGLNRRATQPHGSGRLLIPVTDRAAFANAIDRYPDERIVWKRHVVRRGESLGGIAKQHHTTVAVIRSNNPHTSKIIHPNDSLLIPASVIEPAKLQPNPILAASSNLRPYRVRPGDSLSRISHRFDTTVAQLIRINSLTPDSTLQIGRELLVPAKSVVRRRVYTVQRGDAQDHSRSIDAESRSVTNSAVNSSSPTRRAN